MTARRLKAQGKTEFALLFERLFPDGLDTTGRKRYGYCDAIKERADKVLVRRGYNDNSLLCRCQVCSKHFEIDISILSDRVYSKRPMECAAYGCSGAMLPVFRKP